MLSTIFGAGASHSYSGSHSGICPPLAKGLFDAYKNLPICEDYLVKVGGLVNYVRDTRGVDPLYFQNWNEDIETFLTEIHESLVALVHNRKDSKDWFDKFQSLNTAFNECIFLFNSVINEIQNGKVCKNYLRYVRNSSDDDVFITLNWDCLLDRVLWERGSWSPVSGYGIQFKGIYDDGWGEPSGKSTGCKIIKLHGSTNWLIPYLSYSFQGERELASTSLSLGEIPVFCFIRAIGEYPTFKSRSKLGYEPFSYYYYPVNLPIPTKNSSKEGYVVMSFDSDILSPTCGQSRTGVIDGASMPLIIAPIKRKEYNLFPALEPLWTQAWNSIFSCDELRIIGYSFPVTDEKPWYMLLTAVKARNRKLSIRLVDPFPETLARRLESELGSHIILSIEKMTFKEYTMKYEK